MKKWILTIIIFVFVLIIFMFWGNDEQDLGDNYYFLPEYEAIDIGFPDGPIIYKAQQKFIFNDIKLRGNLVSVNSNSDFIIAAQKTDSLFVVNDSLLYYIIVKKSDSTYGPYNRNGYMQKRDELCIPSKLVLKDVKRK